MFLHFYSPLSSQVTKVWHVSVVRVSVGRWHGERAGLANLVSGVNDSLGWEGHSATLNTSFAAFAFPAHYPLLTAFFPFIRHNINDKKKNNSISSSLMLVLLIIIHQPWSSYSMSWSWNGHWIISIIWLTEWIKHTSTTHPLMCRNLIYLSSIGL